MNPAVNRTAHDGLAAAPPARRFTRPGLVECAAADTHTPTPEGYAHWHGWAQQMSEAGWMQRPCTTCGAFAVWVHPDGDGPPL